MQINAAPSGRFIALVCLDNNNKASRVRLCASFIQWRKDAAAAVAQRPVVSANIRRRVGMLALGKLAWQLARAQLGVLFNRLARRVCTLGAIESPADPTGADWNPLEPTGTDQSRLDPPKASRQALTSRHARTRRQAGGLGGLIGRLATGRAGL